MVVFESSGVDHPRKRHQIIQIDDFENPFLRKLNTNIVFFEIFDVINLNDLLRFAGVIDPAYFENDH